MQLHRNLVSLKGKVKSSLQLGNGMESLWNDISEQCGLCVCA